MTKPLLASIFPQLHATLATAQVPSQPCDWLPWRGPQRAGIRLEKGLLKACPKDGPKLLWQVEHVGAGCSTIAAKG